MKNNQPLLQVGSRPVFMLATLQLVIYLSLGFYCLMSGDGIFYLLNLEPASAAEEALPPGGTLNLNAE